MQPYAYFTLGQIYQKKGDAATAEYSFRTGIEIAHSNEDQFIESYLHRIYGEFLLAEKRLEDAGAELNAALTMFTELGIVLEIEKTRRLLELPAQTNE